ncbi:hypothetical protein ACOME3_003849 [Neoechinorhynchus agilis]
MPLNITTEAISQISPDLMPNNGPSPKSFHHPDLFPPVSPVTTLPTQLSISPKHNQTIVKDPLPAPSSPLISHLINDKECDLFPYKANQLSCDNPNMPSTPGNEKSSMDPGPN